MITRAAPRCHAPAAPSRRPPFSTHMTMPESCALAWQLSGSLSLAFCYLFLFSPQGDAFHGFRVAGGLRMRPGAGLSRRLILHRCISRLKLDNSSTRLGCRSPMSLLSLAVFSQALFGGYVYAALTCQLWCNWVDREDRQENTFKFK